MTKLERMGWTKVSTPNELGFGNLSFKKVDGEKTYYISVGFSRPGRGMYGNRGTICSGTLRNDHGHIVSGQDNGSNKMGLAIWLGRHLEWFKESKVRERDYEAFLTALRTIKDVNESLWNRDGRHRSPTMDGFPERTQGWGPSLKKKPAEVYEREKRRWFETKIAKRERAIMTIQEMKNAYLAEINR